MCDKLKTLVKFGLESEFKFMIKLHDLDSVSAQCQKELESSLCSTKYSMRMRINCSNKNFP